MSKKENSREDIERSSEEILEETMKEIYDGLQDSAAEDVQAERSRRSRIQTLSRSWRRSSARGRRIPLTAMTA